MFFPPFPLISTHFIAGVLIPSAGLLPCPGKPQGLPLGSGNFCGHRMILGGFGVCGALAPDHISQNLREEGGAIFCIPTISAHFHPFCSWSVDTVGGASSMPREATRVALGFGRLLWAHDDPWAGLGCPGPRPFLPEGGGRNFCFPLISAHFVAQTAGRWASEVEQG